jgi:tRNA (uracil-5-)-methyltransferase TRM9
MAIEVRSSQRVPALALICAQTLLRCISPSSGRLLVYVWAVEQDHLSKRVLPSTADGHISTGQDVFVPWVLSQAPSKPLDHQGPEGGDPKVFNRYYHMFASGELEGLAREAAAILGLEVISKPSSASDHRVRQGIEIVRSGWERSNWYIELKRWQI